MSRTFAAWVTIEASCGVEREYALPDHTTSRLSSKSLRRRISLQLPEWSSCRSAEVAIDMQLYVLLRLVSNHGCQQAGSSSSWAIYSRKQDLCSVHQTSILLLSLE